MTVSRGRLLVIDDDVPIRRAICGLLRDTGFECAEAGNGREGLDWLKSHPAPDLIILDLMMPEMDGWEFRLQQRRDPRLAAIPVVAVSADRSPKAVAIDADRFLAKPFEIVQLTHAVSQMVEVAQARRAEGARVAQAEKMMVLGRLAAGVAHEINNPLAFILSNLSFFLEMLPEFRKANAASTQAIPEAEMNEVERAIGDAVEGGRRIEAIVTEVKSFTRADGTVKSVLDMNPLVEAAAEVACRTRLGSKGRIQLDLCAQAQVTASPGPLTQVITHLLLNAADALPVQGATGLITVRTRLEPTGVVMEVEDDGSGIAPEVMPHIFDPFFTTKPPRQGTGLGLFVVHSHVKSLEGEITVTSDPGRTLFRVSLPGVTKPEPVLQKPPVVTAVRQRERILVIGDTPEVVVGVYRLLRSDHFVQVAQSGEEGLELARRSPFTVVLCQLQMRALSGERLWNELKRVRPALGARFIFLTTAPVDDMQQAFIKAAACPVLNVPVESDLLDEAIRALGDSAAALGNSAP